MTDFERIKERIDLKGFIEGETGLKMKRSHLEECPFCQGHECFSIDSDKGVYKCFQCDVGGDVFTFLEAYHNMDKAEALKRAALAAGLTLTEAKRRDVRLSTKERIFLAAADYYQTRAWSGLDLDRKGSINIQGTDPRPVNGARGYLVEQRLHKEEIIKAMHVGWTDGGLVDHLRNKGFSDGDIKASGLARERSHNGTSHLTDFFVKGLAIFPHFDGGKVLHFTFKDPAKKFAYQLPNEARSRDWRFYNQGALAKFNEVLVVEGENDILSVMDAGVNHVIGLIGQPSEAQIAALKRGCVNKHLYLWLDNDEDPEKLHAKGKGFTRKICEELRGPQYNVRIIMCPEEYKDPDDYLKGRFGEGGERAAFVGTAKHEIKRLQQEAVDYITWEIAEIARLDTLDTRLTALKDRKIFAALGDMVEADKLVFIEKIEALGLTRKAIQEQIELGQELLADLEIYQKTLSSKRDADPNYIASIIYRHMGQQGQFFRDREGKVYLFYKHLIYEIGNNLPFNALMKKTTRFLHSREPGKSVWESIACEAYNYGRQIDLSSWKYTDRATDTIYINLNASNNVILKINKDGIEEIPNGLNKEGVLLRSSRKILPVNFLPDADVKDGMLALKRLVFANLACEREQKYLVLCWFMMAFLLDFAPYYALMKFSGATSSGKTTAAKLLSLLIYGNEHLGDPSTAAMYAVSSQNPLLIIDNLEHEDITKGSQKFMLLSVTKGGKEKRTQGTETGTIEEMPNALILVTAIEPFTKPELINRTYDVEYSDKYKGDDFIEDETIRSIVKKRDLIISAMIKLLQKEILPNLEKRKEFITILKKEYKGHAKNRTDEFLALMMLILDKVVRYISYYTEDDFSYGIEGGEAEIRKAWIEYQDAKAKDTETASSNIIKLLDGIVRECLMKMKEDGSSQGEFRSEYADEVRVYSHPEYLIELMRTKPQVVTDDEGEEYVKAVVEFVAPAAGIVYAFDRFCKNNGLRNPYGNAGIFGERLKNDRHLLEKAGWELVPSKNENVAPYFKVIKGQRFWKFRKTIVR